MVRYPVGQAENIREVLHALQDECVGEVPLSQFVFRSNLLIGARRDLRQREIVGD